MHGKIVVTGIQGGFVRIIDTNQGSDEWVAFRRRSIGASDLPVILGISPWRTPLQLWREKIGLGDGQEVTSNMAYGHEIELVVRQQYPGFVPVVAQHEQYGWAIASLDGWDGERVLEIKSASRDDHTMAEHGLIPPKYLPQLAWQLFVTGANEAIYASYNRGAIAEVRVARDQGYIDMCFDVAQQFWSCMENLEPPDTQERDYVLVTDEDALAAAEEWRLAKVSLDAAKAVEEAARERLLGFTDDGNCAIGNVRVTRVHRIGSIDWNKVWSAVETLSPETAAVIDPASYRKGSSGFWKVSAQNG